MQEQDWEFAIVFLQAQVKECIVNPAMCNFPGHILYFTEHIEAIKREIP